MSATQDAAAVLVQHQRYDSGSCTCGWSVLGASHALHQAAELDEAGLLRDDEDVETLTVGTWDGRVHRVDLVKPSPPCPSGEGFCEEACSAACTARAAARSNLTWLAAREASG